MTTAMPPSATSPSTSNNTTPSPQHRIRKSCDACQEAKVKCSQKKPSCGRCERQGQPCTYSPQRRIGRPRKRASPVMTGSPEAEADEEQGDGLFTQQACSDDSSETQQLHDLFAGCSPDFAAADCLLDSDFVYDAGGFSTTTATTTTSSSSSSRPPTTSTQSILFGGGLGAPLLSASAIPPTSSGGGSNADCGSRCYTALLLQLLHLHQALPDQPQPQPGIDTVLLAEREMRAHQRRVFACGACGGDRSSLLLLATVAERVVQALHLVLEKESAVGDAASSRGGGSNSYPSSRRASVFSFAESPVDQRAGGAGCYVCPLPLQVGGVRVDDYSKKAFLKALLQLRLARLARVLGELQDASVARPGDCMYFASELFLGQSLQRVEYLRGQIQVWDY